MEKKGIMAPKHFEIEIRRLGCGWGSLPFGSLRKAWETYCRGEEFLSLEEAIDALGICLFSLEEEEIYNATVKAHPAAEENYAAYEIYSNEELELRKGEIAETLLYAYDDGECRIVECE